MTQSPPLVFRVAVVCFKHRDGGELRQGRLDLLVDPDGDIFRRRIFETRDLVEAMVIELRVQRREDFLDVEEIDDEAGLGIDLALRA